MAEQISAPGEREDSSPKMKEALERIEAARAGKSTALDLSNLHLVALPESLWLLTALISLNLSRNELASLPESLGNLTALEQLYLYGNRLASLPESLGNLTDLQALELSNNQLTYLPESLGNLSSLQKLDLSGNELAYLPESLGDLNALRILYLFDNQLAALPASVGNLTDLQALYLSGNQLATLPESIGNLTDLRGLYLSGNQLHTLPEPLWNLTALIMLDLSGNQLATLPESVGNLTDLRGLLLSVNRLDTLPESLQNLTKLTELYLHGNPLLGLPAEILGPTWEESQKSQARMDPRTILAFYFAQRKRGAKPLNEVKLLLVGHGRVGKTSLSKALRGVPHDAQEPETPGIERHPCAFAAGKFSITAHIWDFGGQEFLHQTHQFFFSERSIYLVVLAGRDRVPMQEAEYWLRLIRTYGIGSPVVILLNKIKEHYFTVDEFNLKDRFPEVKAVVEVDCDPRHKITDLKRLLGALAAKMPGVREKIAPSWAKVRTELEKMEASFVSYGRYREICVQHGVKTEEQQDTLATILNCLGIALNYRTDPRLRDASVLKPRWLVDGIYMMLRWLQKHERNGVLQLEDFGKALVDKKTYPPDMHEFLLALMEKFELCFPLDKAARANSYLIPGLLSENQPREMKRFVDGKATRIQLRYEDVRPPGLIPRFIVRSHTLSVRQPRWRRGVVLARGKAHALVRGDHAGRVTDIFAIGDTSDRVWLTEFILGEMKVLNDKLPVKTLIESGAYSGAWSELENLRADALKGEETRAEQTSDRGTVQVNVKQTLREVESAEASRRDEKRTDDMHLAANQLPLFICYSRVNERLVRQLKPSLTVLARRGYIAPWRDTDLVPGEDFDETIIEKLSTAKIILFMVSRHFLASTYVTEHERPLAMQLMEAGSAVVVPVLLSRCSWQDEDFARLENLPRKGEVISSFNPRENAWALVEAGIMQAVEKFRLRRAFKTI